MAGTYAKFDISEAKASVARFIKRAGDMQPALKAFGEYMLLETDKRFSGEHDPAGRAWHPLSPATLKTKKGTKILTESSQLRDSVIYGTTPRQMAYGTNKIYGAIHQGGGKAGRGHKVTLPQREFLGFNDADIQEFYDIAADQMEGK